MFRASNIALVAAFVALAATLGFVLAAVPNVELVTLTVFLGGAATGMMGGMVIGALAGLLHSSLNPLGMPLPFVLLAQILGWALAGLAGGKLAPRLVTVPVQWRPLALGLVGGGVTLVYQILVGAAFGLHVGPIVPAVIAGLAFTVLHLASNTIVFAVLGVAGLRVLMDLGQLERRS